MAKKKIVIVGGGPTALLLAHYLVRRPGHEVHVHERRPDPRGLSPEEIRTYPIALQQRRGLAAVRQISGLEAALEKRGVWAVGAALHRDNGKKKPMIIKRPVFLTIDRNDIPLTLLEQFSGVEPGPGSSVHSHFESTVETLDLDKKIVVVRTMENGNEVTMQQSFDHLVAADGARSVVREKLLQQKELEWCLTEEIADNYKSLYCARTSSAESVSPLLPDHINSWMLPGGKTVILAPSGRNREQLSGVIVFPEKEDPFALGDAAAVKRYLAELSPHLAGFVSDEEAESLRTRPVSTLLTVKCSSLQVRDGTVVLLGDAAHAVSASLGQGCNSALQDVQMLAGYLDQYQDDWSQAVAAFATERLPCGHALKEMSDYSMPRTKWMRIEFIVRQILWKLLPSWLSSCCLRPLPMQLLTETDLSYSEILEKTQWWIDRVKRSRQKE
jgi:kynurenine 3-monooxygenase